MIRQNRVQQAVLPIGGCCRMLIHQGTNCLSFYGINGKCFANKRATDGINRLMLDLLSQYLPGQLP